MSIGIDIRNGTLLHLVHMRIRAGWSKESLLRDLQFDDTFCFNVARAMRGDTDVTPDERLAADKILQQRPLLE